jgi:hypothetical protein
VSGDYSEGQRVLIKRHTGVREAIVRSFRLDDQGEDVVIVDLDPPMRGAVGGSMGLAIRSHQIIGPVVTKR